MREAVSIIEARNVQSERLQSFSLDIKEGEIVTLIGPSGAGKSSLLMLFNRLEDPVKGQLKFRQKNIKDYPIERLRKEIGMVFQSSSLFDGTVADNLKYGPSLFNEWEEEDGKRLLEIVQLPTDYMTKDVQELSGGERQRVAFARTLANKPEILLLDEVTSALDLRNIEMIEQFLLDIVQGQVKAIMMVTHDINQAKRLGNRTIFLDEGKIVEQGETNALLSQPKTSQLKNFLQGKEY